MKSRLLTVATIIPCLIIFFFILYPTISNRNRIIRVGKQLVLIKTDDAALNEWNRMLIKYLKFPLDHHYGSHAVVLLAVLHAVKSGPILELGMGSTSSPLLHRLAMEQKRSLVSADSDIRWINYFSSFNVNNTLHQLKYVEVKSDLGVEWSMTGLEDMENWTVVFIDHRPGPRRQFDLMIYASRSDVVVLHDTEKSSLYKYNQGLSLYPYQYRFTKLKTYTDILSSNNEAAIHKIRYLLDSTSDVFFTNITLT